jgi:hypothetical protein
MTPEKFNQLLTMNYDFPDMFTFIIVYEYVTTSFLLINETNYFPEK